MDDVRLALLGDKAAQERVTERGELIPCPFCGEEKANIRYACGDYFVECLNCHSTSSVTSTKDTVVKDWNTRAPILMPEVLKKWRNHDEAYL